MQQYLITNYLIRVLLRNDAQIGYSVDFKTANSLSLILIFCCQFSVSDQVKHTVGNGSIFYCVLEGWVSVQTPPALISSWCTYV